MNNQSNFLKGAQKISVFLLSVIVLFGLWSPVANANLSITTLNASNVTYNNATLNGMLNEGSLSINAWFEFGTNPNLLANTTNPQTFNSLSSNFTAPLSGLSTSTTYYFRAVAQNVQGQRAYGNILSFTTAFYNPNYDQNNTIYTGSGAQPGITTNGSFNITGNSAILNGLVNGNGLNTTAWFEYGTSNINFTNSTTQEYYGANIKNFNITIIDLKPNTLYYFRAVAQNVQGRVFGNILSFVTGSQTYTNNTNNTLTANVLKASVTPATNITATTAQLNAIITNSGTTPSNTYFEWGLDSNLANKTENISTGALPAIKHINIITGLKPNTTYYFRAVADNGTSKSVSETIYFTTNETTAKVTPSTTTGADDNTNTVIPANPNDPAIINLSSNAFSSNFLPNNILSWLLTIILVLTTILIIQYAFFPRTVTETQTAHH